MKKILGIIAGLVSILSISLLSMGCSGETGLIKANLGQEFSLSIGQEAIITGEDLRVRFEDVLEDSRCPINVTCIWEGRASCLVRFTYEGVAHPVVLSEPGLSENAQNVFDDYTVILHLKPYPGEVKSISKTDYRLQLTINKQSTSS